MNFLSRPFSNGVLTHIISVLDSGIHEPQFESQHVLLLMMRFQTQEASFLCPKYLWLSQLRAQLPQVPPPSARQQAGSAFLTFQVSGLSLVTVLDQGLFLILSLQGFHPLCPQSTQAYDLVLDPDTEWI